MLLRSLARGMPRRALSSGRIALPELAPFPDLVGVSAPEGSEDKTPVVVVTMERPPVNALDTSLLEALAATLTTISAESSGVSGVVLASGPDGLGKVFSAGLDLECFMREPQEVERFWKALQSAWSALFGCPVATVAAVAGHAPAGGCLLAASCDYRVISRAAALGLNETTFGLVAPGFFVDTLSNVVSRREAESMLLTGKMVPAEDALRTGLVDEVVDKDEVLNTALARASSMVKVNEFARRATKAMLRGPILQNFDRKADLDAAMGMITSKQTQAILKAYAASLKAKAAKAKL